MVDLTLIKNLTLKDLSRLDGESLAYPLTVKLLQKIIEDPMFDLESGRAYEVYQTLNQSVTKYSTAVQKDQDAYNGLMKILWQLSWKALPSTPLRLRKNILSDNVIFSLKQGIDIKYYLKKVLDPYEFGFGPDKETRRDWAYVLENNQDKFGKNSILSKNAEKLPPILGNWLKLYNEFASLSEDRGKFQQINFLNSEKNVALLSTEDKEILQKIISIYDWLLFPSAEVVTTNQESSYVTKEKFTLPQNALESFTKQPPKVPAPKNAPQLRPINEISKQKPLEVLSFGAGLRMTAPVMEQTAVVKNQVQNSPTLPAAPVGNEKQKEIDQKLEELRKKMGGGNT